MLGTIVGCLTATRPQAYEVLGRVKRTSVPDDVFRDRQAEAGAGRAGTLDEALKYPWQQLIRDSMAGVADSEGDVAPGSPCGGGDSSAGGRVTNGIGEQVAQDTTNARRVGINRGEVGLDLRNQLHASGVGGALKSGQAARDENRHVDSFPIELQAADIGERHRAQGIDQSFQGCDRIDDRRDVRLVARIHAIADPLSLTADDR